MPQSFELQWKSQNRQILFEPMFSHLIVAAGEKKKMTFEITRRRIWFEFTTISIASIEISPINDGVKLLPFQINCEVF